MRPKALVAFLLIFISTIRSDSKAVDPYEYLYSLSNRSKLPRLLNSDDVQIRPSDPQPLFAPRGDFDNDGTEDVALSGIYDLPLQGHRYFLLVATDLSSRNPTSLYYKEFDQPVFIHRPGSTGEKDPGNQAFSITFCSGCSDGLDFYWDPVDLLFTTKMWQTRVRKTTPISVKKDDPVAPEVADNALKVAGALKDIQMYIAKLKEENKELGTRVEPAKGKESGVVNVVIYEKKGAAEEIYDVLTTDTNKQMILKRTRKIKE